MIKKAKVRRNGPRGKGYERRVPGRHTDTKQGLLLDKCYLCGPICSISTHVHCYPPIATTYRAEFSDTLRLSIPIIIAQLGVVLMGVTDNLFVGRLLGALPLGAAGLANSLSFLMSSIGVGGLSVVAALVSKANNQEGVRRL